MVIYSSLDHPRNVYVIIIMIALKVGANQHIIPRPHKSSQLNADQRQSQLNLISCGTLEFPDNGPALLIAAGTVLLLLFLNALYKTAIVDLRVPWN